MKLERFKYIIEFEWVGDIGEFFSSMFENITEFSIIGIVFGLVGSGTVYFARSYMLNSFTQHMTPASAIFWSAATYFGTFMAGYLLGKHFENT